ncbi:transcriptional regulator [Pedobacter sp. UBA4863]|uniref:tetratricopeptide repeat protein n=1 Tax=Pedobacter sp. UBA4863 TaxID=1947060 RepID=UPI0025D5E14A|nr:transcriptional regulator [Pedobacter sp. UBA4863]
MAQYENLLHKPYKEKVNGVHAMYQDLIGISDSTQRAKKADEIKAFARKHKDRGLELEVHFFQVFWNAFYQNQPKKLAINELKEQLSVVSKENIYFLKSRALRALAEFYWKKEQNYELAFEQYLLLDKELATIKPSDYPEMARDLMQIGQAYYFFQDYALAVTYFKKAIQLPENTFNAMVLNDARNTLGLCYQQLNNLDSADYYFKEVQKTTFPDAMVWKRIAIGNLGNSMYLRKQYDKAIPLLEIDFNGAVVENDYGCAAGASILLADIYRDKGNLGKAGEFIEQAKYHVKKAGQPDRLRLLYPVMSKWYAAMGNTEKSKQYIDSSVVAFNRYNEKFSALKVLRAQQKVDRQKEQLQLADKQRKIIERNLMIAIVIGLCVVLVLGYLVLKRRQQAIEIAKLKVETELKKAQDAINLFIYKINEQSKITEKFSDELKKLKSSETEERILLEKTVTELRATKILTDEDWIGFQKHFAKIYPNFIKSLKIDYPTITEAELRYLMLSKLQLSHKEMAQALGISPDAVRVTWNRVRKKMGGTLNDTPQSLVGNVVS